MCSNFIQYQKNYCTNNSIVYSKAQSEVSKQLLPLRSPLQPFVRRSLFSHSIGDPSLEKGSFSNVTSSPHQRPETKNQKQQLAYIEKDKRIRQMIPQQPHYQAYDRPFHYQSRKMTSGGQPMPTRTPSSGFSSASSSENMLSGLSLNDNDQKLNEMMMDPAAEVDLDMFLLPEVRYKPIAQPSASTSRANLSQISVPSQNGAYMRQVAQSQAKNKIQTPCSEYSYSNIKRSSGYIDYMPTSFNTNAVAHHCAPSAPVSSNSYARCNYCWKTYVELCQRMTNIDPVLPCDGPWQWHSLYDSQGRVVCPRLWFAQIDRAGSEIIEQLGNLRNAPV